MYKPLKWPNSCFLCLLHALICVIQELCRIKPMVRFFIPELICNPYWASKVRLKSNQTLLHQPTYIEFIYLYDL